MGRVKENRDLRFTRITNSRFFQTFHRHSSAIFFLVVLLLAASAFAQEQVEPKAVEGVTPVEEVTPDASPTPDVEKSIEELFGPDTPRKSTDSEPKVTDDKPENTDPILYICDSGNGRIVIMKGLSGDGFTSIGLPGYGMGRFLRPAQLWIDYEERLYVADSGNNRVIRIDQNKQPGWTEVDGLSEPQGVAVDGTGVYVSDTKADRVVIYDAVVDKAPIRETLTHPEMKRPTDLWIDGQGALYICCGEDPPGGKLIKTWVEKERRRWTVFEGEGLTGSQFLPSSMVTVKNGIKLLDGSGQRLVSMQDLAGARLKEDKFRTDPRWRLSRPKGLGVDATGRMYIADSGNDRILELSPSGNVVGEFMIIGKDPSTMLSNPASIFIYSPAPGPPPKEEKDDKKGKKGKSDKGKKDTKDDDLEFDSNW